MSNIPYRSKFNWSVVEGEIARQVSYNIQANESTNPIPQEQLLNPDACLVLEPDEAHPDEFCEQSISVSPVYQVLNLALLVECSKIETYLDRTQEYHQTYHGELVFDDEDSSTKLYRFDVVFEVSGTSEFKLRYISPRDERLCLYGMHLVLEKNANPLGMMLGLDRAMIECRLDDSKLSEKAVRCKDFMMGSMGKFQMFQNVFNNNSSSNNANNLNGALSSSSSGGLSDDVLAVPQQLPAAEGPTPPPQLAPPIGGSFNELLAMRYIDSKFVELQNILDAKLQAMQAQQNQKLDQILSLLSSLNSK